MDAVGPLTRLAHEDDVRPIYLFRDWEINECARTVFHQSSGLLFLITYETPPQGGVVAITALSARLAHACDGDRPPSMPGFDQIAKDAIHAFALTVEVCQQPIDPDQIPF